VSNPPYIRPDEAAALAPEVREHEPALALFLPEGRPDHWLVRLLDEGLPLVAPGGALLVELGSDQAPRALELARARGLGARTERDLAGVERVLEVTR
jgi:release factor glutamine methyltransferase